VLATKDQKKQRKEESKKSTAKGKSGNGRYLVIVESPAKAKTINKYLGKDYVVKASMGHVRDLPENGLAIDLENNFSPTYQLVPGRKKVVNELIKLSSGKEAIYLATDLDREGEAIAWHLSQALETQESQTHRVVFNEITRSAIQDAFSHPRHIDMNKVNAQQARRLLDRIGGGEISQEYWTITGFFALDDEQARKLAPQWAKFISGGSDPDTGRTQKEMIQWASSHQAVRATLVAVDGKPFRPTGRVEETDSGHVFHSAVDQARRVAEALGFSIEEQEDKNWSEYSHLNLRTIDLAGDIDRSKLPEFRVSDISTRRSRSKPNAPFTTATLQQAASSKLSLSPARTMQLAQKLYEGMELPGEEGPIGLITYMRTDSTNLSKESVQGARQWIEENCGKNYLPDKPNMYGSAKRAQEAHEAIRPTDPWRSPETLKGKIDNSLFRLYSLIWQRFTSSQMTPAEWDSTTVSIKADTSEGEVEFKASGRTLVFDGYYKVVGIPKADGDQILPELSEGQAVSPFDIEPNQQFTNPPPRYSEASLVKRLEAEGIGRPSTYSAIIQTIQDRGYVEQIDRRLYATDKGMVVTAKLIEHFPDIMDLKFTSFMEDELDKVEDAHRDWVRVLHEFYDPFHRDLVRAHGEMEEAKAEPSPYKCEECGSPMVYRWSKTGRFLSCSNYPECKGAMNIDRQGRPIHQKKVDQKCDQCGKEMILRQSRHGWFLGCSGYPECRNIIPCDENGVPFKLVTEKELEQPCDACGEGTMKVRRRGARAFLGCDRYPKCKNTKPLPDGVRLERKETPTEEAGFTCEKCGRPMVIKTGRRGKFIACSGFPRCRNTKPIDKLEELKEEAKKRGDQPVATTDQSAEQEKTAESVSKKGAKKSATGKSSGKSKGKVNVDELGPPPSGFAWTRTGKPVVETWPEGVLHCPQCGAEMNLRKFSKAKKKLTATAIGGIAVPLILGCSVAFLFSLDPIQIFFMGIVISATSIGIAVRTLIDMRKLNTSVGYTIVGAAVVDDIVGIILLAALSSVTIGQQDFFLCTHRRDFRSSLFQHLQHFLAAWFENRLSVKINHLSGCWPTEN